MKSIEIQAEDNRHAGYLLQETVNGQVELVKRGAFRDPGYDSVVARIPADQRAAISEFFKQP
jgi:hypothetical protein